MPARGFVAAICWGLGLMTVPPDLAGQKPVSIPWGWTAVSPPARAVPLTPAPSAGPSTLSATLLSAALPGAGQRALGQRRQWVYFVAEAAGWIVLAERHALATRDRTRYRDLAWSAARIQDGPRVDGEWAYYEALEKWTRSGSYDADPATAGVQPETDPETFNGAAWILATRIFLPEGVPPDPGDPAYVEALRYYGDRAYGPGFLWDWSRDPGARLRYGDLIASSDRRFRQATAALGFLIANHLVAAADAYLSSRRGMTPARLELRPAALSADVGWTLVLRLPAP